MKYLACHQSHNFFQRACVVASSGTVKKLKFTKYNLMSLFVFLSNRYSLAWDNVMRLDINMVVYLSPSTGMSSIFIFHNSKLVPLSLLFVCEMCFPFSNNIFFVQDFIQSTIIILKKTKKNKKKYKFQWWSAVSPVRNPRNYLGFSLKPLAFPRKSNKWGHDDKRKWD